MIPASAPDRPPSMSSRQAHFIDLNLCYPWSLHVRLNHCHKRTLIHHPWTSRNMQTPASAWQGLVPAGAGVSVYDGRAGFNGLVTNQPYLS